jgi:hypothetical protein
MPAKPTKELVEGYEAHRKWDPAKDLLPLNPYPPDSKQFASWTKGWNKFASESSNETFDDYPHMPGDSIFDKGNPLG